MLAAGKRRGAILAITIPAFFAVVMTGGGAAYADSPTTQKVQSNDWSGKVRGEIRETTEDNNPPERPHTPDCSDSRYFSFHVYKCTKKVRDTPPKEQTPPQRHPEPEPAPVDKTDVNSENNGANTAGSHANGNAQVNAGSNANATGNGTAYSHTETHTTVDDHSDKTKIVNRGNSTDDHAVKVDGQDNVTGEQNNVVKDSVIGDHNNTGDNVGNEIDKSVTFVDKSTKVISIDQSVHTHTTVVQQQQVVQPAVRQHHRGQPGYKVQAVQAAHVSDGRVDAVQAVAIKYTAPKDHKKEDNKRKKKADKPTTVQEDTPASPPYPGETLALTGFDATSGAMIGGGMIGSGVILLILMSLWGTAQRRRRIVSPTESH